MTLMANRIQDGAREASRMNEMGELEWIWLLQGASFPLPRQWLGHGANQGPPHPRTLTSHQPFLTLPHFSRRAEPSGTRHCYRASLPSRVRLGSAEQPDSRSRANGLCWLCRGPNACFTRRDTVRHTFSPGLAIASLGSQSHPAASLSHPLSEGCD